MEPSGAHHEGGDTSIQLEPFGANQEAVALAGPNLLNGPQFGTLRAAPPGPLGGIGEISGDCELGEVR